MKGKHGNVFSSMSLAKSLRHRWTCCLFFVFCSFVFCCAPKTDVCSSGCFFLFAEPLLSRSLLMPFDATHAAMWMGLNPSADPPVVHSFLAWWLTWQLAFPSFRTTGCPGCNRIAFQVQSFVLSWEIEFEPPLILRPALDPIASSHGLNNWLTDQTSGQVITITTMIYVRRASSVRVSLNGFYPTNSTHSARLSAAVYA